MPTENLINFCGSAAGRLYLRARRGAGWAARVAGSRAAGIPGLLAVLGRVSVGPAGTSAASGSGPSVEAREPPTERRIPGPRSPETEPMARARSIYNPICVAN